MPLEAARIHFTLVEKFNTGRIDADIAFNFKVAGIPVFAHQAHPHRHGAHGLPSSGGSSVMFGKMGVGTVAGKPAIMGCLRFKEFRMGHSQVTITAYPNYMHMVFAHMDWDSNYMPKTFMAYRLFVCFC